MNVIVGKNSTQEKSRNVIKKDVNVLTLGAHHASRVPEVHFTAEDYNHGSSKDNEPLEFDALGLQYHNLKPHLAGVVGLGDNYIKPYGAGYLWRRLRG
ncbi:hypothetical protein PIB30_075066 [Stylosanthes scabra]|uniref:Uncharacterized protein n=1 Tax=Stylosanthes scabra TaxID=79078 RepID=A0ABU6RQ86_9FABA|nr:hypothetical protein [Stylosanthes scabra]